MKKPLAILIFIACRFVSICQPNQSLDSLIDLSNEVSNEKKVHLYLRIAQLYSDSHSDSLSFEYLHKARLLGLDLGLTEEVCSTYYYLGSEWYRKTNYDTSLYYYDYAMEMAEEMKDDGMIALLQGSIGRCLLYQGKLKEAKFYFDAAMVYARSSGDSTQIMTILGYLGLYYGNKGEYEKCAEMTFEAIKIAEKRGMRRKQSILLTNLCVLHGRMKDYERALKYQRASLKIDQEINDKLGLAYGYNNMGNVYRRMGLADSAMYYYRLAMDYQMEMGNMADVAGLMSNIGSYYREANQLDEAHKCFAGALQIADSLSLFWDKALILTKIGNTYEDQGFLNKAERFYLQALKLSKDQSYSRHEWDIANHLATLNYKMGKYQEAYQYLEDFIALKDSMMNEKNQQSITELRTKYETEKIERENEILIQKAEIQTLELKHQHTRFWIFIGGICFILLLALLAFVLYRMRQRNIRTKLEKQSLENEQRMLRSQMNPHFIFNSMNSIQSYISGNDNKTAMSYLSKFARLMRGILEHSRQSMIPLGEEVETLNLYIELERLRFKNKFEYTQELDSQLDLEGLYVPPMLIQPFVENAIKHGLVNKGGDGFLKLSFKKEDKVIRCIVEDNGIGRDQAALLKTMQSKGHRSLGMQVTRERIEALNKEMNTHCDFTILDMKDDKGKACGTRVEILIPFEIE
ncbi:MAG: DUF2225 domain-containing protein [Bacteroidales bacterium]|nr:DUF2225 domain-containing protein [Bacteroidales bacterium]